MTDPTKPASTHFFQSQWILTAAPPLTSAVLPDWSRVSLPKAGRGVTPIERVRRLLYALPGSNEKAPDHPEAGVPQPNPSKTDPRKTTFPQGK